MFGSKYKRKPLGRLSAKDVTAHRDNCRISSEPVQLSPLMVTTFCYYGAHGQFNVLQSPILPSMGMGGPMMFVPSDKWVTYEQVPDGLAWEKRLLRASDPVPAPPSSAAPAAAADVPLPPSPPGARDASEASLAPGASAQADPGPARRSSEPVITGGQGPTEREDGQKLRAAGQALERRDFATAERLLRDICSRCPDPYVAEYLDGEVLCIKAWDSADFMRRTAAENELKPASTAWLEAVYPPACFRLGFLLMEKQDARGAARWLEEGVRMEPCNPSLLLELGNAYTRLGASEMALDCMQRVSVLKGIPPQQTAAAYRCMGIALIDLGRLDEAEARLQQSLTFDPGEPRTHNELAYIAQLRAHR